MKRCTRCVLPETFPGIQFDDEGVCQYCRHSPPTERITKQKTKFVIVTGGVISSLGKGIFSASIGHLLKSGGLKVTIQKFDPYINIDPGTMNPFQHGEVFVTDDGAETDLDVGHYERFLNQNLSRHNNVTAGQIYWQVLNL